MHVGLEILRWSLCLLMFYAAVFLREDEEGAVQNRLEEWWIRLMYQRDAQLSRAAIFMRGVARLANRAFDSVLGKSLWSFQAVVVSFWFSTASLWLAPLVLSHLNKTTPPHQGMPLHLGLLAISCVFFGILPILIGRFWAIVSWTLVALIFLFRSAGFVLFAVQTYGYAPVLQVVGVLVMILLFSIGFDVLYISITRWMLRRMFQMRRLLELIGLIVLDVVLALALVVGPIEMAGVMLKSPLLQKASVAVLLLVMFNFGDFVACSVFFLVMFAVLVHRLMWPILERPIYALHRYGVIRQKALLWSIGVALWFGPKGIELVKYIIQHV